MAVALKIKELLSGDPLHNGEPVRPSDIAIIMRSAKGRDSAYASALSQVGIPSVIAAEKSFFLNSEVLLTLCLLNSIDNPRRDIYLAGLMRSPLFDFSADELLHIRGLGGDTLFDSLKRVSEAEPDNTKAVMFLERLNAYRTVAEGMNTDRLLARLYRETGLMALASKNGGRENLMLLYDFAKKYEQGGYRGLYSFISYINSVLDRRTTFDDKREGGRRGCGKDNDRTQLQGT
jgi:ATP-dependent helicase/nuclease subunit A